MQPKIYISGSSLGLPEQEVIKKFEAVKAKLKQLGYLTYCPIELVYLYNQQRIKAGLAEWTDQTHRKEIIGLCIDYMCQCDEVFFLDDWDECERSKLEKLVAEKLNMPVIFPLQLKPLTKQFTSTTNN
jgi:hypothetical protein